MIKKVTLSLALLASAWASAQFKMSGEIKNYENQPVVIKIYDNGVLRLLNKTTTDKNGNFSYNFPKAYKGLIQLEFSKGGYQVISDNKDVKFTTDYQDPKHEIYYQGGVNQELADYNKYLSLLDVKDNTLNLLREYYQKGDAFYAPLVTEIERIDALEPVQVSSPEVSYYIDTQKEIQGYAEEKQPENVKEQIRKKLINDGVELENFGFLPQLVTQYVQFSTAGATSREEATQKIQQSVDELLDKVGEETQRGQAVLYSVISLLNSAGLEDLGATYTRRASELTCEISPELKYLIEGSENVKIGNKVPNIVFDKKIKGKKSLYDIKADKKLIIFWGSWCGHCQHEMPFVKEFYPNFKKEGGEIVAFAVDLNENDYKEWTKGTEWFNYSDLLKWDSPVVKEFAVTGTPTMILVDKDNKVLKIGSKISEFVEFN